MIQKAVQDPLAEKILSGTGLDGAVVPVTAGHAGLLFNGEPDLDPTVVPLSRALN